MECEFQIQNKALEDPVSRVAQLPRAGLFCGCMLSSRDFFQARAQRRGILNTVAMQVLVDSLSRDISELLARTVGVLPCLADRGKDVH